MYHNGKIWIGCSGDEQICIESKMANRHGLIAGATGTGKTVTLKVLAESFSDAGVPVFLADVKGDLAGMCVPGCETSHIRKTIDTYKIDQFGYNYHSYPSVFWDIYGKGGIPLRTTISEMGPILLSKLMELNTTQSDILTIVFKIADDNDLLLIDTKDLKAMLAYVGENCKELSLQYGNITKQSVAAIVRHVVALEADGGEEFFAEPALNIADFFGNDASGKGNINILDCRQLVNDGTLYSAFLLWMLSELFETLPEVGDLDKPRMVFFFDEAHLLFNDVSKALQNKIEQIIKLIRSKGVGVYFITQSPKDIPDAVLSQLGNKIQHALHAYTPADEKAIKTVADSFRANPEFDTKDVLMHLGVGQALVSVLDSKGIPTMVKQCAILPPQSAMGTIDDSERLRQAQINNLYIKYQEMFDRDSAYEFLERQKKADLEEKARLDAEAAAAKQAEKEAIAAQKQAEKEAIAAQKQAEKEALAAQKQAEKEAAAAAREEQKKADAKKKAVASVASSAAGTVGREVGGILGKTVGGSFGKKLGANLGGQLGRSILGTFFKK